MADALVECCCRVVIELLCHVSCALAYGLCGAPRRRRDLPVNAVELYIGKPGPTRDGAGICWPCHSSRVLLPAEFARHAAAWGHEPAALDELVAALELALSAELRNQCGGGSGGAARVCAGLHRFAASDAGARWQAALRVALQPVELAPIAMRVLFLGPTKGAHDEEALLPPSPVASAVVVASPLFAPQQHAMTATAPQTGAAGGGAAA